jgi:hypothetical protein
MFLSRVALWQLVTIVALSLCARADSIPYRDSGLKQSVQFPGLYSAGIPSIRLLLDSAIAEERRNVQPQKGVFLVYGDRTETAVRTTNLLEWLFKAIGKLVLPNQGKRARK